MLDLQLKNYVDWRVSQVMPVRSDFGYRIFLKYPDGTRKHNRNPGSKQKKKRIRQERRPLQNYIMVHLSYTRRSRLLIL